MCVLAWGTFLFKREMLLFKREISGVVQEVSPTRIILHTPFQGHIEYDTSVLAIYFQLLLMY